MNWHHWYWWMWPTTIAIGFAWSYVLMCLIPPRISTREWLRAWKGSIALAAAPIRALKRPARP